MSLLQNPRLNRGTAFTDEERDALRLRGLLPPRVFTLEEQESRILLNFHQKPTNLEKYIFLIALQDRNETLFYRTLVDHIQALMPIVYTPTVGEACKVFGHIYRRPRGLYVTMRDRGRVRDVLRNWAERDVAVIVVTDGERILGLGDLGAYGMGIPVGKLALYTACAGIDPAKCLPVVLDVGTNNTELLADPLYTGIVERRTRGSAYDDLVDEFVAAVQDVFPGALIQFEDFATENAFRLLERHRRQVCTFNDDIQGTAAVTLAGLVSAGRMIGQPLTEQTILFFGAGAAATGIADLVVAIMARQGTDPAAARRRCWFVDSTGLVVASRGDLAAHKRAYAQEHAFVPDLLSAVRTVKPTALIGASGQPQTFTEDILRAMAEINKRPVVFALSNPTSKAECTAEQAYRWTEGRAVFASGSPFDPVTLHGRTFVPAQGNNAYIFPGVGLSVTAVKATRVTDEMFAAAAATLASLASDAELAQGSLFPPLNKIRDVSLAIAISVAEVAYEQRHATLPRPKDLAGYIKGRMYEPEY